MSGELPTPNPLALSRTQRSHLLLVLSGATHGHEAAFLEWYRGTFRRVVAGRPGVLHVQQYEQHEFDITQGRFAPFPLRYLAICELALDGAQQAEDLMERVDSLHRNEPSCEAPALWVYYPISEKVGRAPAQSPSMLTLAFANGLPGRELEFREWYVTRHIRHALNVSALVSGQCFERTLFQRVGALSADFTMLALYEQEGTPESIIESFAAIPAGTLDFPAMDLSRFAEWVYRPV
jgi:hypothetical protein